MPLSLGPYTLDSLASAESNFNFSDPVGTGLQTNNTARRFCWHNADTTSSNVGPTSGAGGSPDGYVYTEASSPGAAADQFYMELDQNVDCATYTNVTVEFKTNQRGTDNDATCQLQSNENGAGWVDRGSLFGGSGDTDKVATSGTQIWSQRSIDVSALGVSNSSTRFRLEITLAGATIWNCDYGIDEWEITGDDAASTDQEGYGFYNDGTESGATTRKNQDTVDTCIRAETFQVRVLVNTTGDLATKQFQLEAKETSDSTYREVPLT